MGSSGRQRSEAKQVRDLGKFAIGSWWGAGISTQRGLKVVDSSLKSKVVPSNLDSAGVEDIGGTVAVAGLRMLLTPTTPIRSLIEHVDG